MRASGLRAELRRGYYVAMRLGPWVIEPQERRAGWLFRATVAERTGPWTEGLDLAAVLGPVEWIWRDVPVAEADGQVTVPLTRRPDTVGDRG
jgi:hypothetical protein